MKEQLNTLIVKNHNMRKKTIQHQNQKSGEIPGFSTFCTKKMKTGGKSSRKVLILQYSSLSKDLMVTVTVNSTVIFSFSNSPSK